MIQITADQIERVNLILSGVPKGAEKAMASVIRRANNTVRSEALKGHHERLRNHPAECPGRYHNQSEDAESGRRGCGNGIVCRVQNPLYRFNVSPDPPVQRATVSAAVLAESGRTPFAHAFIAKMKSGHTGMFERDGTGRLPITEFMGPSAAQMAANSVVVEQVEEKAQEVINKRIEHEITRILNGYGG